MNTQIHSIIGQAWKDLSIGVEQEDLTMAPIFESELEPEALINPRLRQAPELSIELRIESSHSEPELGIKLRIESSHSEPELNSELWRPAPTRAQARAQAQFQAVPELRIELEHTRLSSQLGAQAQLHQAPELRIELEPELERELNSEPSSTSELEPEPELWRGT
ncbi:hypothetical protein VE00_03794 [Pseudogymnoascus sp. WSF 3629]|nr:hypothetical protein VE00_03794 [Pseudogymnoascus sp. WSF 3629]